MAWIYKWTNLVNGKVYIGQTRKDAHQRMVEHVKLAAKAGGGSLIHAAMRKHGLENFQFDVLFFVLNDGDLDYYEEQFIAEYDCCVLDGPDRGYNVSRGGGACSSEVARMNARRRVNNGTHPWLGERGSMMNREHTERRIKAGTHNWQGEENRSRASKRNQNLVHSGKHPFQNIDGESIQTRKVKNGKHHFQGESGRNLQKRLMEEGKHPSVNPESRKRISAHQKQMLELGNHNTQVVHTCPHCGKCGDGPAMFRWHFQNCKQGKQE